MSFDFKNPFSKLSKPQLYAAIGGTVLVGGYIEYKHHSSTGSWNPFSKGSTAASGSAIDPVTNLPVSEDDAIDPITGLAYLAEAQEYGSVATAEASVSAYGASSATGSGVGVSPASPGAGGSTTATGAVGSSTYTSNAAWAQAATDGLADIGYSETDVATALGDYLTSTPVTATQAGYINTAIAEYGPAPIGSFQIILIPTTPPATTPTTPTAPSTPTTPVKTPGTTPTAPVPAKTAAPAMPTGVTTSGVTASGFTVKWNAVKDATSYRVRVTYQSAVTADETTSDTSKAITGQTADHTYTVHVSASNSAGTSSETNGPSVKTSK
jgi:hypothetical protein